MGLEVHDVGDGVAGSAHLLSPRIGTKFVSSPELSRDDQSATTTTLTVLKPNMVITIEPGMSVIHMKHVLKV